MLVSSAQSCNFYWCALWIWLSNINANSDLGCLIFKGGKRDSFDRSGGNFYHFIQKEFSGRIPYYTIPIKTSHHYGPRTQFPYLTDIPACCQRPKAKLDWGAGQLSNSISAAGGALVRLRSMFQFHFHCRRVHEASCSKENLTLYARGSLSFIVIP